MYEKYIRLLAGAKSPSRFTNKPSDLLLRWQRDFRKNITDNLLYIKIQAPAPIVHILSTTSHLMSSVMQEAKKTVEINQQ